RYCCYNVFFRHDPRCVKLQDIHRHHKPPKLNKGTPVSIFFYVFLFAHTLTPAHRQVGINWKQFDKELTFRFARGLLLNKMVFRAALRWPRLQEMRQGPQTHWSLEGPQGD
ncbi:unnamed protein product, partial [Pylaiella littoralis]